MTPCRRVLPLLEAFADGELASDKILEVEQHLAECAVCAERVRFSNALHLSTRRVVQEAALPSPAFVERLQAALDAEYERQEARSAALERESKGKILPWRVIVPVAAAASFTLLWAAAKQPAPTAGNAGYESASIRQSDVMVSPTNVEQLVDELVSYHAKAAAPEVTQPTMVPGLEPRVGVPVRLPSLHGAQWEGASVVPMHNQRAASLRYNLGNHRVTVYVYNSSDRFRLLRMLEPRVVRNQAVYVGTRRGYSIAAREQRGVGYAVATDLDDRESAELVASIP